MVDDNYCKTSNTSRVSYRSLLSDHVNDLERLFGGDLYKALLNPSSVVEGMTIFGFLQSCV